jgi:hypothetical protein
MSGRNAKLLRRIYGPKPHHGRKRVFLAKSQGAKATLRRSKPPRGEPGVFDAVI